MKTLRMSYRQRAERGIMGSTYALSQLDYSLFYFESSIGCTFPRTRRVFFFLPISLTCYKVKWRDRTSSHLLWWCPRLRSLWDDIFHLYRDIYCRQLIPDGLLVILGCSNYSFNLPPCITTSPQAWHGHWEKKKVILREWKSVSPACCKKLNDTVFCLYLEDMWYTLSNAHPKIIKTWGLLNLLRQRSVSLNLQLFWVLIHQYLSFLLWPQTFFVLTGTWFCGTVHIVKACGCFDS